MDEREEGEEKEARAERLEGEEGKGKEKRGEGREGRQANVTIDEGGEGGGDGRKSGSKPVSRVTKHCVLNS